MSTQQTVGLSHQADSLSLLSPREKQVLTLVCEGHATKSIAYHLGISFKTAACYRMRLMEKAGVHNSISLFRWALARGLVSPDPVVKPAAATNPVIPFPAPAPLVVERKPPAMEQRCVLIVDDDQALRQFVATVLEQEGYCTLQAQDGSEALLVAERNHIDLLLTDFEMPGITGLELIRIMHQHRLVGPVLVVTGHGDRLPSGGESQDRYALLAKPFTCRDLVVNVRAALEA